MNSRLIRVLLVVIAIAIITAAGYFLKQTDAQLIAERAAADTLRDDARALAATIADVRAAQVAYVARGQGEDFWMGRVTKVMPVLQERMAAFNTKLTSPPAQAAFEPASASMENFQKLDSRAQEFVKGGNGLLAADLIFSDGLEATSTAATQIDVTLREELQARQAATAAQRRRQLAILGGSAGGVLLILLVLALTGRASNAGQEDVVEPTEPVDQPRAAVKFTSPITNLSSAAQLCTDFARALESRQLPGLLERTAKVLEASGVIVWTSEPMGKDLRPAMSFGYSDQVMARMGAIPRDASNAVASAFRAGEMRTVSGDRFANGALVAPLLTPDGCIGVLSAEMKGGSEKDESSQALAAIFAAQLATLVSPPPSAGAIKAAAQG